jgi:hypothetical protein
MGWSHVFEDQRRLAKDFEDIRILGTLGPDLVGCHLGEDGVPGNQKVAEQLYPMIEARFYGGRYDKPITPPDVVQAAWSTSAHDEIVVQFDQPVKWTDSCVFDASNVAHTHCGKFNPRYTRDLFGFDSLVLDQVASGRSEGDKIRLKLKKAGAYKRIAYPHGNLNGCVPCPYLTGAGNDLGVLGFYIPIADTLKTVAARPRPVRETAGFRLAAIAGARGTSLELALPQGANDAELILEDLSGRILAVRKPGRMEPGTVRTIEMGHLPAGLCLAHLRDGAREWRRSVVINAR